METVGEFQITEIPSPGLFETFKNWRKSRNHRKDVSCVPYYKQDKNHALLNFLGQKVDSS